jgi:hypothetical protein
MRDQWLFIFFIAAMGHFESVSVIDHGVQDSRVEDLARTEGEHGRWPIDVGELRVPMADAATGGHSMGESIKGARSHCLLLNKESVWLSPTWRANYRCFVNQ